VIQPFFMSSSVSQFLRCLVVVLCVVACGAPVARAQTPAASTTQPTTRPVLAAATSSDVWVLQRTRELLDSADITIIRRMSTSPQSDGKFREADVLRGDVVDLASQGNRLVVLFADGSWGTIAPDSRFTAGSLLQRGLHAVAVAGDGEAVWFLCKPAKEATTIPATRPVESASWWLLKRERSGTSSETISVPLAGSAGAGEVAVSKPGDVLFLVGDVAMRRAGDKLTLLGPVPGATPNARLVPLEGWPVPAVLVAVGARVELVEWTDDRWSQAVPIQVEPAIGEARWAVAVVNASEMRFVARANGVLVDQILKRDGSAVRGVQPLQIVPSDRAPPGSEAINLALMLALGAVVLIVWQRASRPGAAGTGEVAARDASGKPMPVVTPAPLSARCLAASIDYTPVWIVAGIGAARGADAITMGMLVLAAVVGYVVYCALSEIVFGRTIGKSLLRLRVVTVTGEKPHVGSIITRNALRLIEAHPLFMVFALFSMVVTPMRQRLGDFVAGTTVVQDMPTELIESAETSDNSVQNPPARADDKDAPPSK
jgi:uncharacterized RDD family membrane protein YckC